MPGYELRVLEERIAAIEENLGIEGAKTLAEAANDEAERAKNAAAQEYKAKYAQRIIWNKSMLEKFLMTTIVVFCDSIDDPSTRKALEYMDDEFRSRTNGQYYGIIRHWEHVHDSWGIWEKNNPEFELTDEEIEEYTEGNDLPIARLPNRDPESSDTTLMVMGDPEEDYDNWVPLEDWFEENRGKMSY